MVLGHSVGGGMAVACAAAYPRQCIALIAEAAQAFNEDKTKHAIQVAAESFQDPQQLARLAKYHADKAPWVLDAWVNTWLSAGFSAWHLDEQAQKVQAPSLILQGEFDEYVSLKHPQRLAAQIGTQASIKIIAASQHVPHQQYADEVLNSIQDFLAQLN